MLQNYSALMSSISAILDNMSLTGLDTQNFETDGYKKLKTTFRSLYSANVSMLGGGRFGGGAYSSQGMPHGIGLVSLGYDMTQGALRIADKLNAAIQGSGFFLLEAQNRSSHILTRASDFIFSADGTLVDSFGRKVKGYKMVNGVADQSKLVDIRIDPDINDLVDIGFESGGILTSNFQARKSILDNPESTDSLPDGTQHFQLALAKVPNPEQLTKVQGESYVVNIRSGSIKSYGIHLSANFGSVEGGMVETSNVKPEQSAIKSSQLQRHQNLVNGMIGMTNQAITTLMSSINK